MFTFHQLRAIIQIKKAPIASHGPWPSSCGAIHLLSIFRKISLSQTAPLMSSNIPSVKAPSLQLSCLQISRDINVEASEDVFEMLHAVRLEKHQED